MKKKQAKGIIRKYTKLIDRKSENDVSLASVRVALVGEETKLRTTNILIDSCDLQLRSGGDQSDARERMSECHVLLTNINKRIASKKKREKSLIRKGDQLEEALSKLELVIDEATEVLNPTVADKELPPGLVDAVAEVMANRFG